MKLIKGKTLLGKIIYPMVAESPRHQFYFYLFFYDRNTVYVSMYREFINKCISCFCSDNCPENIGKHRTVSSSILFNRIN